MPVAGIIAEYNPLHLGHLRQMEATRAALGPDTAILCVMSGNFVQRGEPALVEKRARAAAAAACGADLVLELPTPWAAATAERFAQGAVSLLERTGVVDCLSFGSESGDLIPLQRIAQALADPDYPEILSLYRLTSGRPFAAARQMAVADLVGEAAAAHLEHPNDILAVEYLRALDRLGSAIRPLAIPRQGPAHDQPQPQGALASASALRRIILDGRDSTPYLPGPMAAALAKERAAGQAPASLAAVERAILSQLRRMGPEELAVYDRGREGLCHRLYRAVQSGANLQEVLDLAKTRRYPMARLRRMVLHAWLGLDLTALPEEPPYLRVLAIGRQGRQLLRRMKETARLPVLVRPSQTRALPPQAAALLEQEGRWTDLYTLAWPVPTVPGEEFRRGPVFPPVQLEGKEEEL